MYAGRYLTAKISEFPSHEIECSLSDILEDNVPEKYYLSRKQAEKLLYKEKPTQGERIYSSKGLSCTLTSGSGGFGGHSGLYLIENTENFGLPIKSKTKDGYQIAYPGDSIDTAFSGQNSRRGRVGSQVAHTLTTSATQAYYFIDLNPNPKLTEIARCITARHDSGISNRKTEHSGVFVENSDVLDDNEKFAVAFIEPNGEVHIGRIRKLTPRECWRLQGFTDDQFDKAKATGLSDSRLYKMAGNAVTVNVISEIGKIIKKGGVGVTISSQSGWRMPALTAEEDELLATTPTEELLKLPLLQPENIKDTLHAYQMAKRCNEKRVMAEAVKWGQRGARLNDIAPGIVVTPLAIDEFNGPRGDFYKNMFANCPAGRPGTADEIANVAELLMSDKAAFITGSTFLIDGGATASYFYGPLAPKK